MDQVKAVMTFFGLLPREVNEQIELENDRLLLIVLQVLRSNVPKSGDQIIPHESLKQLITEVIVTSSQSQSSDKGCKSAFASKGKISRICCAL